MPSGALTFIGNATVLIEYGSLRLLTDPNFLHRGQRAYLGWGLSAKRLTEPALSPDQLGELDAVVLSHLHGDHWDRVARRALDRGIPIVTTPHAARRLQGWHGFRRASGLATWESQLLVSGGTAVRVTSLPGRHAPGPIQWLLPPVMGSLLEFGDVSGEVDCRVYLSGDTLMFDGLREIAARYPHLDLGVVHLGGTTLPGGIMVTMDGEQGAEWLHLMKPTTAVPVHTEDYTVFRSPRAEFEEAVRRRGLADRVRCVEPGERIPFGS
ncbi:L-ascorbate metabolism protein UlaG, beta-lactamase superfamily [Streptoalloteichus tenebrarius]|uniref:L-ascorbate metabolism protein UlaG, beta-lactamase superfamily n=1 Tax=Streptoalloteichus tenebrarius (strain ATCC 17920 / DSM 40477 / JCM 4838 / CBS 697.72 / NBRC 16177 / NCIMB 11028 / NRRL B-12390 / A12253. 1 / ISP 5477) TaxID=1933 RepID=A0ABT1HM40_STRSD|nr:MBL fold metallo-hydrolase [Streptoalloteichus tenebrarius]MCP2256576.1 L-ascorbate metabolism protein UlaG, beta-lactamase superfamily [Streptoalloteichus tenebrarius]BFF04928.1 MBL fold metallo-hydrolase [Streptoalloteichus tenebrarius]